MFSTTVTEGTHTAQVTTRLEDCGATFTDVVCSCGYSGTETDGNGCWQQGHNVASEVDATHTPLLTEAYAVYAT